MIRKKQPKDMTVEELQVEVESESWNTSGAPSYYGIELLRRHLGPNPNCDLCGSPVYVNGHGIQCRSSCNV